MMLSQRSYGLCPGGNVMSRVLTFFLPGAPFLYPLKTSENLRFSDVFGWYKMGTPGSNGLTIVWLESPSNFLVSHGFTCWLLICF